MPHRRRVGMRQLQFCAEYWLTAALVARLSLVTFLTVALVARLSLITFLTIALIAGLSLVAFLARRLVGEGRADRRQH